MVRNFLGGRLRALFAVALAPLLLVGAAAMVANRAHAQVEPAEPGFKVANARMMQELIKSRGNNLRTSAGPDPDTVWFGHSYTDHWSATENWWNLYTGVNYPGTTNPNNAIWDWDHSTGLANHGIGDSLAGWWPMRRAYSATGGLTLADASRPWWALDYGNQTNYVINAGAGGKRTKGVVGVWHADPGKTSGIAVRWSPLSGSQSAWCGLRHHGDNTVVDAVTGNPFNQTTLEFNGNAPSTSNPTGKRFPGYADQWDQMLYRDLVPPAGQPLSISFLYRTRMSTSITTTASTRTGWFHGDPLFVTAGNFISSTTAGANAPTDSFQVYIGVPVDDANCTYSDGSVNAVYDPQRRWFSEVLRIFEGASYPYYRIFAAVGNNPADTLTVTNPSFSVSIPASDVDAIRTAPGNTSNILRLVFRVKTNRNFSDETSSQTGYNSAGRGAAQIDDVIVNGNNIGDFEGIEQGGMNTIDNRVDSLATNHWKSTGKPPAIYLHTRALSELAYADLCGPPDSPARSCNIFGTVISVGNYDDGERAANSGIQSDREVMHGMFSPTINLLTPLVGANAQGLTTTIVDVTDDIYVWYDFYAGMFNLTFTGNTWVYGTACYPARMGNGGECWGELIPASGALFNPAPQCLQDYVGLIGNNMLGTSRLGGVPDSIRIWVGHTQQCFRFAVSLGCNSAEGGYFDNISLGFVDLPASTEVGSASTTTVGTLAGDIWSFWSDAFPVNEAAGQRATTRVVRLH